MRRPRTFRSRTRASAAATKSKCPIKLTDSNSVSASSSSQASAGSPAHSATHPPVSRTRPCRWPQQCRSSRPCHGQMNRVTEIQTAKSRRATSIAQGQIRKRRCPKFTHFRYRALHKTLFSRISFGFVSAIKIASFCEGRGGRMKNNAVSVQIW